jgi:hypothetical protein
LVAKKNANLFTKYHHNIDPWRGKNLAPGGRPVESQVVLLEKTPESSESLDDNSAKNLDLCM